MHAPSIGLLFERKEHLAFGAVVLAWAGAAAYFAAPRRRSPRASACARSRSARFAQRRRSRSSSRCSAPIVAVYRSF